MRDFLNGILTFIGATSLTDDEFGILSELDDQSYTDENYEALLAILQSREAISQTSDRLRYYFLARGVYVEEIPGTSQILIGGSECE